MPKTVLGGNTGYVPNHEASRGMVVDFARNPKKFAFPRYVQVVKVPQNTGFYLEMDIDEAGRASANANEYVWPDGADAPSGRDGLVEHEFKPFLTERRAYPFTLGELGVEQATWDVIANHAGKMAQKAMTVRTQLAVTQATTAGNYSSGNIIDVSSLSGVTGNWTQSTSQRLTIKRTIEEAKERILDATLAAVDEQDLKLVIPSTLAKAISETQEIVDYIKGSPQALAEIKGELQGDNFNSTHGLPKMLYGLELCVEKTRRVTSRRGGSRAVSNVLATGTPFITARPGGYEGVYGAPSFSGLTCFMYEEMTTETKRDKDNRRHNGRIVENFKTVVTAPAGMTLIQNAA